MYIFNCRYIIYPENHFVIWSDYEYCITLFEYCKQFGLCPTNLIFMWIVLEGSRGQLMGEG